MLVIDVKSSGSESDKDAFPVSIGVAGKDGKSWGWTICPLEYWTHWDDAAEDVHGLSRDKLIDEGYDPFLACRFINDAFRGKTLLIASLSERRGVDKLFKDIGVNQSFKMMLFSEIFAPHVVVAIFDKALERVFTNNAQEDAKAMVQIIQAFFP